MKNSSTISKIITLLFIALFGCFSIFGQGQEIDFHFKNKNKKRIIIPFEMINNLIVISAQINEKDTLRFILDTGVRSTLITNLQKISTSIEFQYSRRVQVAGLGEGKPIGAYFSYDNSITFPGVTSEKQNIIILDEDIFQFSSFLGLDIHGLIGYNFFKNFLVEISYEQKRIFLYNRKKPLPKKFEKYTQIPMSVVKGKPYINATTTEQLNKQTSVKLLIDSGSSAALSIFRSCSDIQVPSNNFKQQLGIGLNGAIYGATARLENLEIAGFKFPQLITSFPEERSLKSKLMIKNRNGSIGGEILRRFSVLYDYQNHKVYMKANRVYKSKFTYNMSGLTIINSIPNFPIYEIVKVRKNSVSDKAGFKVGDNISTINNLNIANFDISDINYLLQKENRNLKLTVSRNGKSFTNTIRLEDELNPKLNNYKITLDNTSQQLATVE